MRQLTARKSGWGSASNVHFISLLVTNLQTVSARLVAVKLPSQCSGTWIMLSCSVSNTPSLHSSTVLLGNSQSASVWLSHAIEIECCVPDVTRKQTRVTLTVVTSHRICDSLIDKLMIIIYKTKLTPAMNHFLPRTLTSVGFPVRPTSSRSMAWPGILGCFDRFSRVRRLRFPPGGSYCSYDEPWNLRSLRRVPTPSSVGTIAMLRLATAVVDWIFHHAQSAKS